MENKGLYLRVGLIVAVTFGLLALAKFIGIGEQVETYSPAEVITPTKVEVLDDRRIYTWGDSIIGDSIVIKEVKNDSL
tara:strand:- start:558 stop:791 length:234 start_codon:yes stop_codon:yes gene_type:complete